MFRVFQVAKKLAGQSKGTATWATNVGNEVGQVLITADGQGRLRSEYRGGRHC